nr:roadblock/LC7 domain-containing protein [Deinobacterium chartae]
MQTLAGLPGVRVAVLAGADGLALEYAGEEVHEAEQYAAELAGISRALVRSASAVNGGRLLRYGFATENLEVLAVQLEDRILAVAVRRGSDTRALQIELARLAVQLMQPQTRA